MYHQGVRTRAPLYSSDFEAGVKKAKTAILQALTSLDRMPAHLLRFVGREGRAFKRHVEDVFRSEEAEKEGTEHG